MPIMAPAEERFERHVVTREAQLLCSKCGTSQYRPHVYDHLEILHDADNAIQTIKVMFRCVTCGTVRQWGAMGAHPDHLPADDDE